MKAAPTVLVVDASILLSAVLGRSTAAIKAVGAAVSLITSERAIEEATRRLVLGMGRPDLLGVLDALLRQIEVVPGQHLADRMAVAVHVLRDAAQSRNGTTTDAHVLALAWESNAEVWSHDRDFAGTGVASWSTVNLLRALAEADESP